MKTAAMRWASLSPGFRILFLLGILISFAGYTFAEDDLYDYFRLEKEIAIDPFCVDPPLGSCNEITQNRDGILFMGFFPSQRLLSFTPEGKPLNIFTGKYEAGKRNPYLIANDPFFCEEEGYIVVSDFFNRRVMYFNLNAKLKDSFIANADKLYDLTQTVHFRDYVLVGGMALDFIQEKPLLWNGWYLHVFDRNGKYLKSLFEAYPEMVKNNRFRNNGGLVAVAGDRIYCAQTCHYLIS
ncbi:hypothetical protein JW877_01755, partial [bacterium]|nr:hypothetical protein [bacterium]